ncbi:MAG: hypothetical protein ACK54F_10140 [Planctomycetia bacterium]
MHPHENLFPYRPGAQRSTSRLKPPASTMSMRVVEAEKIGPWLM